MHTRSAKFNFTPGHRSGGVSLLTLLAGFTISACSAFFVPDDKDDGVLRCNTTEDCAEPDDNRHVAQCVFGEGQPENSDKVCSSAFRELGCHPQVQNGEGQLEDLYDDVTSNQVKALYGSCTAENEGKRGCAPSASGCNARPWSGACSCGPWGRWSTCCRRSASTRTSWPGATR